MCNKVKRSSPLKAIRARCLDCVGWYPREVRKCNFASCKLHPYRMGKGARAVLKVIRAYCVWCCNGAKSEVKLCPSGKCSLWPYRMGKRPSRMSKSSQVSAQSENAGDRGVFKDKRLVPVKRARVDGVESKQRALALIS